MLASNMPTIGAQAASAKSQTSAGGTVDEHQRVDCGEQDELRQVARQALELRMARVAPYTTGQTLVALGRYARTRLPDEPAAPITSPRHAVSLSERRLQGLLNGREASAATMSAIYRAHDDRFPDSIFDAVVGEDSVAAMMAMILDGPKRSTRRISALLVDLLNDPSFKPPRGRRDQHGRAAQTLKLARLQLRALTLTLAEIHEEHNDIGRPRPLRAWRTPGRPPEHPLGALGVREDAPTPSLAVIRSVLAHLDDRIGSRFRRRYGLTDLELLQRPDREQLDAPARWLARQGILCAARDRAMLALMATLGTRAAAVRALNVEDFESDYQLRPPITGFAADRLGALRVQGLKGHPNRIKVLPEPVTIRLDVWLWLYRRALANNSIALCAHHPLFPGRRLTQAGIPVPPERYSRPAFHNRFAGHAACSQKTSSIALVPQNPIAVGKTARQLAVAGVDPGREEIWRGAGPHGIRRFADRTVYDQADKYFAHNRDLRRVSPLALKEALLDHVNIGDDPLGYTGLGDEDARRTLACLAAHIIAETIWGDLALRRGPDERHLREALLTSKGLRQHLSAAEDQLREHDQRIDALRPDATLSIREVHARDVLTDCVADLRYQIDQWERRATELESERRWVALDDNQPRIDPVTLRQSILGQPDTPEPIRDWITNRELQRLLRRSAETVRRWSDPSASDRSRPWPADAMPIVHLDKRTALYWVPGFRPDALFDPEVQHALDELLCRWPAGSEWSPAGAKRRRFAHEGSQGGLPLPHTVRALDSQYQLPPDSTSCIRLTSK
jgi:integrase